MSLMSPLSATRFRLLPQLTRTLVMALVRQDDLLRSADAQP